MLKKCLITIHLLLLNTALFGYYPVQEYCPNCAPASGETPHLQYFGGPVVSNIKVVDVLWGPDVDPAVKASMSQYFAAVVNSAWLEGLAEYDTVGQPAPTTNQRIGPGEFLGQFEINPANPGPSVTEQEVRDELTAQITAGNLPPPQYDQNGNPQSFYVVEFPPGVQIIADGGSQSCVVWCAFHSEMLYNNKTLMYAVQPDFSPGSGCASGCGNGTMIENQQSVHNHELAETITDPKVVEGPLAWYDPNFGENSDICVGEQEKIVINGQTFVVQKSWSNKANACLGVIPYKMPIARNFKGKVIKKGKEIIHQLTWEPSPSPFVKGYYLSQNGVRIATIPSSGPLKVNLRNRVANKVYKYGMVAFDTFNHKSFQVPLKLPK